MLSRREILKLAGGALGGGALSAKEPSLVFPATPRERIAVASYPFRAFIDNRAAPGSSDGKMPLTGFPAMVVERYGIHNVELLGEHFPSIEAAYLKELREALVTARCRLVNLPASPRASFYDPDAARRAASVEESIRWVDAARALDCPSVRLHIAGVRGVAADVDRASDSLRKIAAYGEAHAIVINLENDDPKSEEAGFIVKLIERVNSPWLRGLPDFCNSMLIGPEQYNYDSMRAMFAHAYNISHVKDSEVDGGKVYRVDMGRTFQIAKASGYRGYFSMEWEGEGGPYEGTAKLIEMSLKSLGDGKSS
ncbi:MAG: sugar phosphate isomerase/epimerase family protein [Bryobacteraceae bacterium]|jgi:sugar phosphate isomerase/epimerase